MRNDDTPLQDLAKLIVVIGKFLLILYIFRIDAVDVGIGKIIVAVMRLEIPFEVVQYFTVFINGDA